MIGEKELLRTYRMFQKMMQYPHLLDDMRAIFIAALKIHGITDQEKLEAEAGRKMDQEGVFFSEENQFFQRFFLIINI